MPCPYDPRCIIQVWYQVHSRLVGHDFSDRQNMRTHAEIKPGDELNALAPAPLLRSKRRESRHCVRSYFLSVPDGELE